jgi:TolB-like protein
VASQPAKKAPEPAARPRTQVAREYPDFPREEPGQRTRFWAHVTGWTLQSAWIFFNRFPKWMRLSVYVWLAIVLISRGCTSPDRHSERSDKISPAAAKKLKEISESLSSSSSKPDVAKLGELINQEVNQEVAGTAGRKSARSPLLAIPFSAPSDNPGARKLAASLFALVYGRVAISHHGQVGLADESLPSLDPGVAVERGHAKHSTYVLYGGIENQSGEQRFTVKIVAVEDGSVVWSESYSTAGADLAKIAAEVDSEVPSLDDGD